MKLPFQIDLTGKVAAVTGGAGVLCAAFAEALALCGAKVAIIDRNEEAGNKVVADIRAKGGIAEMFQTDCLDVESLKKSHEAMVASLGECDTLINGAGGNSPRATTDNEYFEADSLPDPEKKDFFSLTPDGIRFVFDLNVTAAFLTTQIFAKGMALAGKGGNILNISSMNAFCPLTKIPAYSAAKAAVSNFTQWLAVHFANANVRVNAIAPGFFVTKQNQALLYTPDGQPTARTGKILRNTPMNRFGEADELIGALLWLVSEGASFVTGVVLPVDGGFSAYSGV